MKYLVQGLGVEPRFRDSKSRVLPLRRPLNKLVWVERFELSASCAQGRRSAQTELYPGNWCRRLVTLQALPRFKRTLSLVELQRQMVRAVRVELTSHSGHRFLRPARLPIPPHAQKSLVGAGGLEPSLARIKSPVPRRSARLP